MFSLRGSGVRRKFPRGGKFRNNRVTSQINFRGSAEDTTILGDPGLCPLENFAKLHLKIRIFVHSGSKFYTILFLHFLFLGSEGVAMAQWPPPSVRYCSGV